MKKHHHRCVLLLLMISAWLVCSSNGQPVLRDNVDWQNDCSEPCKCSWKASRKVAECRPVDRIPDKISSEVQTLDLSDNGIVVLEDNAFQNIKLIHLQQIDLHKNIIRQISRLAFQGLQVVTILDLSYNNLENIDPLVFEPLKSLRQLVLKGNPFQRFMGSELPTLLNLESIDLSSCHLTTLPSGIFNNVRKLSRLNLSGNKFQQLSVDVVRPLHLLSELNLVQNPFACDCHLKELHEYVIPKLLAHDTTCELSTSNILGKKQFYEVKSKDFYCVPQIVLYRSHGPDHHAEDTHIRSVESGSDLTFDCQIEGDPLPEILWLRNGELLFNTSTDFKNDKYIVYTVESSKYKLSNFTIKDLGKDDSGVYTCSGKNIGATAEKSTELNVDSSVYVSGVLGRRSKTWIWILLGILGVLVLIAIIVLIVLCYVRQKRRARKAQRVADIDKNGIIEKKLYENRLATPLIDKSKQATVVSNHVAKEEEATRTNFVDGGHGDQPMTPVAATPLLSQYLHPSVPSTPTFLPNHYQQSFVPQPQLHYHPGGWATYDPRRRNQDDRVSLNYTQPVHYSRMYSPFSGSVASFTSEPPRQGPIFTGPGYVTLPRRHRIPSWSTGQGASGVTGKIPVPPSPTGSLPLVPNLRQRYYGHMGPRYDTVGPRTTADGGSNLSLNKLGLGGGGGSTLGRPPMTPSTPSSARIPLNRSLTPSLTPSTGRIPKLQHQTPTHFNFDPIFENENDGPTTPTKTDDPWSLPTTNLNNIPQAEFLQVPPSEQQPKQPPIPPAKPKRKSANLEEEEQTNDTTDFSNIQGTEV